jgi:hypothetical protein
MNSSEDINTLDMIVAMTLAYAAGDQRAITDLGIRAQDLPTLLDGAVRLIYVLAANWGECLEPPQPPEVVLQAMAIAGTELD